MDTRSIVVALSPPSHQSALRLAAVRAVAAAYVTDPGWNLADLRYALRRIVKIADGEIS